jgi:hypothetical protein
MLNPPEVRVQDQISGYKCRANLRPQGRPCGCPAPPPAQYQGPVRFVGAFSTKNHHPYQIFWTNPLGVRRGAYFITEVWPDLASVSFHPVIVHNTAQGVCEHCDLTVVLPCPGFHEFQIDFHPTPDIELPMLPFILQLYLLPYIGVYTMKVMGHNWEKLTFQVQLARQTSVHPLSTHNYISHT